MSSRRRVPDRLLCRRLLKADAARTRERPLQIRRLAPPPFVEPLCSHRRGEPRAHVASVLRVPGHAPWPVAGMPSTCASARRWSCAAPRSSCASACRPPWPPSSCRARLPAGRFPRSPRSRRCLQVTIVTTTADQTLDFELGRRSGTDLPRPNSSRRPSSRRRRRPAPSGPGAPRSDWKWQARPARRKRGELAIGERANAPSRHLSVSCPDPPTVGSRLRWSYRV